MNASNTLSQRRDLETRYQNSRVNLLFVVLFTVINVVLLVTQSDTYFLFSAFIPYVLVSLGMILCGMYPQEYYGDDFAGMEFLDKSVFAVFLLIAVIAVVLYLISWIFSKKYRGGWLIFALIIFAVDTLVMFAFVGFALDSIIDIAFHVWVIVSLARGIHACGKLKKMPAELPEASEFAETEQENKDSISSES